MKKKCFLTKIFADGETDTASHKRLVCIISLLVLIVLAFLSAFGYPSQTDFIYIFGMLTGGESLLTTIEKSSKKISRTTKKVSEKSFDEDYTINEEGC